MTWRFYAAGHAQPVMELHVGLNPLERLLGGVDYRPDELAFGMARMLGVKEIEEERRDEQPLPHPLSCHRCGEMPEDCECPCLGCGSVEGYCTCPEPGDA